MITILTATVVGCAAALLIAQPRRAAVRVPRERSTQPLPSTPEKLPSSALRDGIDQGGPSVQGEFEAWIESELSREPDPGLQPVLERIRSIRERAIEVLKWQKDVSEATVVRLRTDPDPVVRACFLNSAICGAGDSPPGNAPCGGAVEPSGSEASSSDSLPSLQEVRSASDIPDLLNRLTLESVDQTAGALLMASGELESTIQCEIVRHLDRTLATRAMGFAEGDSAYAVPNWIRSSYGDVWMASDDCAILYLAGRLGCSAAVPRLLECFREDLNLAPAALSALRWLGVPAPKRDDDDSDEWSAPGRVAVVAERVNGEAGALFRRLIAGRRRPGGADQVARFVLGYVDGSIELEKGNVALLGGTLRGGLGLDAKHIALIEASACRPALSGERLLDELRTQYGYLDERRFLEGMVPRAHGHASDDDVAILAYVGTIRPEITQWLHDYSRLGEGARRTETLDCLAEGLRRGWE